MKKIYFPFIIAIVIILTACTQPVADLTEEPATRTALPVSTSTPTSTLPPTLTPIQLLPTSTPLAFSTVEISKEDYDEIERAKQEIPSYRQGDLTIRLLDDNEKPLSGYSVQYQQISHEFQFMSFEDWPSNIRYLGPSGFNGLSLNLWWTLVEPEEGKFDFDFVNYYRYIEELHQGGYYLKAQGVFFPTGDPTDIPSYLYGIPFDELSQIVDTHMSTLVSRFAPYIDRWEAINEPDLMYRNPFHLTKEQYLELIKTSASAIRKNDPTATIEINFGEPCQTRHEKMLQDILDAGVDFDVVGLQYYYNSYVDPQYNYQPPRLSLTEISSCLDRYEKLVAPYGKRIAGSEVAIPSEVPNSIPGYWGHQWDDDLQAQYLSAIYTIFFSKPSNMSINYWCSVDWEGSFVWKSGLVDINRQPKKSLYALQDLLRLWTTFGHEVTDKNGEIVLHGFGGKYEIVFMDPNSKSSMQTNVEVQEQESETKQVVFEPNSDLFAMTGRLQSLIDYWTMQSNSNLVQNGKDYLMLVNHHIELGERNKAEQTLKTALDDLAIQTEIVVPIHKLVPVGYLYGFVKEKGSALMWGATTLHLPYDFPAGTVTVEIKAHAHNEKGESPIMVSGVGANYSQVWKVDNTQSAVYTFSMVTTGNEEDFTIRFPYDRGINERIAAQNGNIGELKLYIDQVILVIKTTEIP